MCGFFMGLKLQHHAECHSAPASAAAFILAPKAPTTTLTTEGRVKPLNPLHLLNPHARQGVSMQAPKGAISSMRLWQDWPLTWPPPCPLRGTSPASGSRTTRAHYRATYERNALRSLVVPPPAGERWCRQAPKGGAPPQAAFILAPQAPATTLTAKGRVKPLNPLPPLNPHARQGVSMQGAE